MSKEELVLDVTKIEPRRKHPSIFEAFDALKSGENIIPSLSGVSIPYSPYFYAPLILLHVFLFIRVIGNFAGNYAIRSVGSWWSFSSID